MSNSKIPISVCSLKGNWTRLVYLVVEEFRFEEQDLIQCLVQRMDLGNDDLLHIIDKKTVIIAPPPKKF